MDVVDPSEAVPALSPQKSSIAFLPSSSSKSEARSYCGCPSVKTDTRLVKRGFNFFPMVIFQMSALISSIHLSWARVVRAELGLDWPALARDSATRVAKVGGVGAAILNHRQSRNKTLVGVHPQVSVLLNIKIGFNILAGFPAKSHPGRRILGHLKNAFLQSTRLVILHKQPVFLRRNSTIRWNK